MTQFQNLTGKTFSEWTVLNRAPNVKHLTRWRCRCSCGNEVDVYARNLITGCSQRCESCADKLHHTKVRHYFAPKRDIPEHGVWKNMIARCYDRTSKSFPIYGDRGISVYEGWINDFEAFYAYMGPRPTPQHTLERINNDGNYEPGNVKWDTRTAQARNTRRNRIITIDGVSGPLPHVCEILGLDLRFIKSRVYRKGRPSNRTPQQAADIYRSLNQPVLEL